MEIYRENMEVFALPETAKCLSDDMQRNPQDIQKCPLGNHTCSGGCEYYTE